MKNWFPWFWFYAQTYLSKYSQVPSLTTGNQAAEPKISTHMILVIKTGCIVWPSITYGVWWLCCAFLVDFGISFAQFPRCMQCEDCVSHGSGGTGITHGLAMLCALCWMQSNHSTGKAELCFCTKLKSQACAAWLTDCPNMYFVHNTHTHNLPTAYAPNTTDVCMSHTWQQPTEKTMCLLVSGGLRSY